MKSRMKVFINAFIVTKLTLIAELALVLECSKKTLDLSATSMKS